MQRAIQFAAALAICSVVYLVAWPVPIQPIGYELPKAKDWEPTGGLHATRVELPDGHGP